MPYHTVFDVRQIGFQWWIPALMFMFSSIFALIGWGLRTSGDKDSIPKGTLFQLGGRIGILATLVFGAAMYAEYRSARKGLDNHQYSVAEGTVHSFVPMPPGGHSIESFVVNGVRFEYGAGWGSTRFNSEWKRDPVSTFFKPKKWPVALRQK